MLTATDELWGYRALVQNLTNRQLKSQYKESLFGNLWSMINPAATIGVYSLVFGVLLKFGRNIPGIQYGDLQSFPLYLFCGIIMWSTFNRVAIGAMGTFSDDGGAVEEGVLPARGADRGPRPRPDQADDARGPDRHDRARGPGLLLLELRALAAADPTDRDLLARVWGWS